VVAGYVLVIEAVGWTLAALAVSGVKDQAGAWPIRIGPMLITAGLAGLAWAAPFGSLTAIGVCAFVQGSGFGLAWALASSRIAASAPVEERALASSAIPTTQLIGTAFGAAASALIANLYGFDQGITPERAHTGGVVLFAAFIPLALFGVWAGWKLSNPRFAAAEA
jgi:MFS family permease